MWDETQMKHRGYLDAPGQVQDIYTVYPSFGASEQGTNLQVGKTPQF